MTQAISTAAAVARAKGRQVRPKARRKQNDGARKCGDGVVQAIQVGALRDDSEIAVRSKNFSRPGAKNRLRIRKYDFLHRVRLMQFAPALHHARS